MRQSSIVVQQATARYSPPIRHFLPMAEIQGLLRSHDELRTALIIAGTRIRQLQFGPKSKDALVKLCDVLREARTIRWVYPPRE